VAVEAGKERLFVNFERAADALRPNGLALAWRAACPASRARPTIREECSPSTREPVRRSGPSRSTIPTPWQSTRLEIFGSPTRTERSPSLARMVNPPSPPKNDKAYSGPCFRSKQPALRGRQRNQQGAHRLGRSREGNRHFLASFGQQAKPGDYPPDRFYKLKGLGGRHRGKLYDRTGPRSHRRAAYPLCTGRSRHLGPCRRRVHQYREHFKGKTRRGHFAGVSSVQSGQEERSLGVSRERARQ